MANICAKNGGIVEWGNVPAWSKICTLTVWSQTYQCADLDSVLDAKLSKRNSLSLYHLAKALESHKHDNDNEPGGGESFPKLIRDWPAIHLRLFKFWSSHHLLNVQLLFEALLNGYLWCTLSASVLLTISRQVYLAQACKLGIDIWWYSLTGSTSIFFEPHGNIGFDVGWCCIINHQEKLPLQRVFQSTKMKEFLATESLENGW